MKWTFHDVPLRINQVLTYPLYWGCVELSARNFHPRPPGPERGVLSPLLFNKLPGYWVSRSENFREIWKFIARHAAGPRETKMLSARNGKPSCWTTRTSITNLHPNLITMFRCSLQLIKLLYFSKPQSCLLRRSVSVWI